MTRVRPLALVWSLGLLALLTLSMLLGWVPLSWATFGILVLCFAAELMDSSLGMGYGTTLTPILLMLGYAPLDLVPTILISELLSGAAASFFHHEAGNVDFSRGSPHRRAALILATCSVFGVLGGVSLAVELPEEALKTMIGMIILGAGMWIVVRAQRPSRASIPKTVSLGIVAAFNKAVSGGGYGPLLTSGQILSGTEGRAAIGITSFAEAFTCLLATAFFLLRGQGPDLSLLLCVACGALLSVPFSAHIVSRISERVIRLVIAAATIALGVFTLSSVWL